MTLLADHEWRLKYTPDDGDLVRLFYVPVLEDAVRYDRLTGYFGAEALALAARGIEGLVRNHGRMRLIVGCTLDPPEIEAIEKGVQLRESVENHIAQLPLSPACSGTQDALELLAWMVAKGFLEVKVAVPCDPNRRPIPAAGIFHEKAGIIEDKCGDKLAWNGSLNETASGWLHNWESINIFTSFGLEPKRVQEEEENFARIWSGQSKRVITLDVPDAVRNDLMRFLPKDDHPARLAELPPQEPEAPVTEHPKDEPSLDLRRLAWSYIRQAPTFPNGGERVGEATAAVTPWPHQIRAFQRLYGQWPPKLLIADEVGLGKTIQAGMLLRQAWLAGRARRILILAPKSVLKQWQVELREKFNLNWPIYDGAKLCWYPSRVLGGRTEKAVSRDDWHKEPVVIASSHLMRRSNRAPELLEKADPWDLIIVDEAHHARRRSAGAAQEGPPNALLLLLRRLRERTQGLVLLTATPMQVHPVEVWDLLHLLGMPAEWGERAFLDFFELVSHPNPSSDSFERMADLYKAMERHYGALNDADAIRVAGIGNLRGRKVIRALRDDSSIPRRQLETPERGAAIRIMKSFSPVRWLISRHTRELLRRYFKAGQLSTPIADREVGDRFIEMSPEEQRIYHAVEDYISSTYNNASQDQKSAVGFVMTTYRRRLASSFHALGHTLESHYSAVESGALLPPVSDEDLPDEDAAAETMDEEQAAELERQALAMEEKDEIQRLLSEIRRLPPDTKSIRLKEEIAALQQVGYRQAMVFTQYADTMDFLREELRAVGGLRIMCFSGRGGEVLSPDGSWRTISRDDIKRRFREGDAEVLLCTDAAAEGLNFQFCGALVNYDMPWNPMRVEQRIGRIDRLGQKYPKIRIINLHYEDTVETDVYRALRERIGLFHSVIGRLQPILAQLPRTIEETVLSHPARDPGRRATMVAQIERGAEEMASGGFDIDALAEDELVMPARPESPLTMADLEAVLRREDLLPPGVISGEMATGQFSYSSPGMSEKIRVTTSPEFYEQHSDSVELWSPGSPAFPLAGTAADEEGEMPPGPGLRDILAGLKE